MGMGNSMGNDHKLAAKYLGSNFNAVLEVYRNLPEIKRLNDYLEDLLNSDTGDSSLTVLGYPKYPSEEMASVMLYTSSELQPSPQQTTYDFKVDGVKTLVLGGSVDLYDEGDGTVGAYVSGGRYGSNDDLTGASANLTFNNIDENTPAFAEIELTDMGRPASSASFFICPIQDSSNADIVKLGFSYILDFNFDTNDYPVIKVTAFPITTEPFTIDSINIQFNYATFNLV